MSYIILAIVLITVFRLTVVAVLIIAEMNRLKNK